MMSRSPALIVGIVLLVLGAPAMAQTTLFTDDFEDRVADQVFIENGWTWVDITYGGNTCEGAPASVFGPFVDPENLPYLAENRNFFTAGQQVTPTFHRADDMDDRVVKTARSHLEFPVKLVL